MVNDRPFPLIFVTHSYDKITEVEKILGLKLRYHLLDLPEIQAVEVEQVARYKTKLAYKRLQNQAVMTEDTGLYIEAWNGLPGALIKWFIKHIGPDGICRMMQPFSNRQAYAETFVATYDNELRVFSGTVKGRIVYEPSGSQGFGWDQIFTPDTIDKTFAEMTVYEKNNHSMRRLAYDAMLAHFSYTRYGDTYHEE